MQVVEEVRDVLRVLVLEVVEVDLRRVDLKEQGHERGLAVAPGLVAVVHQRRVVQRRGVLRRPVVQIERLILRKLLVLGFASHSALLCCAALCCLGFRCVQSMCVSADILQINKDHRERGSDLVPTASHKGDLFPFSLSPFLPFSLPPALRSRAQGTGTGAQRQARPLLAASPPLSGSGQNRGLHTAAHRCATWHNVT